jgi:hypothetical protein
VKSTPTRGVKQSLKPDAYKQSELGGQDPGSRNQELFWCLAPGFWLPSDGVPFV